MAGPGRALTRASFAAACFLGFLFARPVLAEEVPEGLGLGQVVTSSVPEAFLIVPLGENVAEYSPVEVPARRVGENVAEPFVDIPDPPRPPPPAPPLVSVSPHVETSTAPVEGSPIAKELVEEPAKAEESQGERKLLAREVQDAVPAAGSVFLSGSVELRMLAVSDPDPANDRSLGYRATLGYSVFPRALAFVRLGLRQRFVAEEGDSAFRFEDVRLGFSYAHDLELESLARTLSLTHYARLWLPTSRASQRNDLVTALQVESRELLEIVPRLTLGLNPIGLYRFHAFAEQRGYEGGMNDQLVLSGVLFAEVAIVEHGDLALSAGVDAHTTYTKKYPSRESYESDRSDQSVWLEDYGWDAYISLAYGTHLTFDISLEHGGPVLRDGIVNLFFTHRDETELVFAITGRH
ncbi:MAG: hypothetical protein HYV07_23615 [Deltaproteobacteria bacterium]|nr:hypothetical protein [Deltaproteobacteria bacterium]